MAGIHTYNVNVENHDDKRNNLLVTKGKSVLANPYTENKGRGINVMFLVKDKEETLKKYDKYYNIMYGGNKDFKLMIDYIYNLYKQGEDVYLGSESIPGTGDIIKKKLEQRLIKERIEKIKATKNI